MNRRVTAWLCLAHTVSWTGLAGAQDMNGREQVRLTYEAPLDCPTRPQFEAQVSQRVSFAWLALEQDSARPLSVAVVRNPSFWQASLTYRANDGHELTRSVSSTTCEASVAAIALATALLIEDLVDTDNARPAQSHEATSLVESPVQSGTAGALPPSAPSSVAPQSRGVLVSAVKAPYVSAAPSSASSALRPEVAIGGAVVTGMSVSPAYGVTLLAGIPIASVLPRFGVGAYQSSYSATDLPGVSIRARVLAALLEDCPVSVQLAAQVAVPLCIGVASGILRTSSQLDPAVRAAGKASSDFWFMASLSPRLRVQGPRFFAQFGPDLVVPVTRREFVIRRESSKLERAYRTPSISVGVQIAFGVQF